jgi:aminomethyltransferase
MTDDAAPPGALLQTALHGRHLAADARMVDFGGWDMPIQYRGILAEHAAVRSAVGVFDLSHMGRLYVRGPGARDLVQGLTTNDVDRLAPGRAQYSLICADDGRILDDVIVYNLDPEILVVVNASNRLKLLSWIEELRAGPLADIDADLHDATLESTMIGFQGPDSARLLQEIVSIPLDDLRYYAAMAGTCAGRNALIARTGYTGEDGFEVIVSAADGPETWDTLLETRGGVQPVACGLGARDTLRLEAGMALYGHEIDETTNPYEAGLGRVVRLGKENFAGKPALAAISEHGVDRKLAAFELTVPGVPRQGYPVMAGDQAVGRVTSGNVSPSLNKPIGMAYVPAALSEIGTEIAIEVRNRQLPARIVPLPFYEHRTRRSATPGASRG